MQTAIAMPKDRTRKMIGAGFFVVLTLIGSLLLLSLFGILPLLMKAPCGIGQYFYYMLIGAALAFPAVLAYMFVPLIIDRFDPEPWWALLMAFIWGGFAATGFAGIINTFTGALLGRAFGTVVSAPLVEEFFKALLVLGMFWFLRTEFDGVVDGVIYATFTALGFATVENVIYYSNAGWKAYVAHGLCNSDHAMSAIAGTFVLRGILSPWGHPLYTSMTGIGIGLAREVNNRFLKFVFPVVGFFFAVTLHGVWNLSAVLGAGPLFLTYVLYIFFIILFTIIMIILVIRERGIIKKFLTDEVLVGTLTEEEAALASSPVGRIKAILRGGRTYRKLVNAAATLALKKWHVTRAMKGNKSTVSMDFIVPLRQQIKQLHDKLQEAKGPQPPTSPPQGGGYGGPPQGGGYGGPPQGGGYGGPPQGGGYYGGPPQGGGYGGPPQGGGYGSPR